MKQLTDSKRMAKLLTRLGSDIKWRLAALCGLGLFFILFSCKKLVEVPLPETELTTDQVFQEDATAIAAMSGIYNTMINGSSNWAIGGYTSFSVVGSVYSDDLKLFSSSGSANDLAPFYYGQLLAANSTVQNYWSSGYNLIYASNQLMEGLERSSSIGAATKQQLRGEALFIRAFCHFYLLNLFGDVPYITSSDYKANTVVSRTPAAEVYQGIIADLAQAGADLSENYPGTGKRVRVNKSAATALLARVYLFQQEWSKAEEQASQVIGNTAQYELLANLNSVFLKNSKEAIWQLMPSGRDSTLFTEEGAYFILTATPSGRTAISDQLWNSFEPGDQRQLQWADTLTVGLSSWYYPWKYKGTYGNPTKNEYSMVMRLAEQYLIRAEARAEQNKLTGAGSAAEDINAIRHRAGLGNTAAVSKQQLLDAIVQERRAEFFAEWGHRFFDLKRWNKLDAVLGPVKPEWSATDALWPIPESEILLNKKLGQNPGY